MNKTAVKRGFKDSLKCKFDGSGTAVLESPLSLFRPAWTSMSLTSAKHLHGVRTPSGTTVSKNYFENSKGLWNGWK